MTQSQATLSFSKTLPPPVAAIESETRASPTSAVSEEKPQWQAVRRYSRHGRMRVQYSHEMLRKLLILDPLGDELWSFGVQLECMYLLEKVNLSLKHTDSGSEPLDWISGHVENGQQAKIETE